jgi:putative ABC transport system permease protein
MGRIAILSLWFDRSKFASALAGVTFSGTLVLAQLGMYNGFLESTAALIERTHGDLWVMGRGTEVVDNAHALAAETRLFVAAHPCVEQVRGMVLSFASALTATGKTEGVEVVGFEPRAGALMPWSLASGLPSDLHGPSRVTVDRLDLARLHVPEPALGVELGVQGHAVKIGAITNGIKPFTLAPYIFAELPLARRLVGLAEGQAHYWVLNLKHRACLATVVRHVEQNPELQAWSSEAFARRTQEYWIGGSGAGGMVGLGAILGLLVGALVVAQTLYSLTKDRLPELATLKALGATRRELVAFVTWQASLLAGAGGLLALALAHVVHHAAASAGISIVISASVLMLGLSAIVCMCAVASLVSVRTTLALSPSEVFR